MKKEEILAVCIEEIRSGKSTAEECAARYPELGKELLSLLEIADNLRPAGAHASTEFKQRAKRYLFEQMQESPSRSRRLWFWPAFMPARILISVCASLLVLGCAGGGTVYAAQSSLPGDTLYAVKIGVENIQLALTAEPAEKANLHLELAQRRIDEAKKQIIENRNVDSQALSTIKEQYNNAIKELSNSNDTEKTKQAISQLAVDTLNQQIELEQAVSEADQSSRQAIAQAINTTRRGNTIAQVAYNNSDYLKSQPSVEDNKLDLGPFSIDGTLLSKNNDNWNVDGTILYNVHYTGTTPQTGNRVHIEGVAIDSEFYVSILDTNGEAPQPTTVEGQFGGNNQNGTANVGGISVQIDDNDNTGLSPGDKVKLEGRSKDGRLNVTEKEQANNAGNNTIVSGTLISVDTTEGTLTLRMTGSLITVNITNAQIDNNDRGKRTVSINDLAKMTGRNIKVSGLTKQDNNLAASQVTVYAK